MEDDQTRRRAPRSWLDAIARGEADLAAGRISDIEPFLQRLEAEHEAVHEVEPVLHPGAPRAG